MLIYQLEIWEFDDGKKKVQAPLDRLELWKFFPKTLSGNINTQIL